MKKCIVCGKILQNEIYSMDNMPKLVQHMQKATETINMDDGMSLHLFECTGCGLVQFDCEPVFYYKDVIRAVGLSETLKKLRKKQYEYLINKYNLMGGKIWEVGSGAGEFLKLWKEYDVEAYGVEHDPSLVRKAISEDLNVVEGYVDAEYDDINGPFDAFVSFNYLEHQPNPREMVYGMYNNLKENGVGLLTVPSFEYFKEKASYYEFMRDHIAYYTEEALRNLFEIGGFNVQEVSRFNGDTTQIIVRKRSRQVLPDFDSQKRTIEESINAYIEKYQVKKMAVWGASHQALTMLATLKIKIRPSYIIDSSDFKWGRISPVSHLRIEAPTFFYEDSMDLVVIMAPAFSDEIANLIRRNAKTCPRILAIKDDEIMEK